MSTKTRRQQKPAADKKGHSTKENTKNNKSKRGNDLDDDKGPGIYTVQEIRDKKNIRGKPSYLVKWEGYPDDQCTWEPIQNLKSVKDMLDSFDRKYNKQKGTSESEGTLKIRPKSLKKNQIQMASKKPEIEEAKKRGRKANSKRGEPKNDRENSKEAHSPSSLSDIIEVSPKMAAKTTLTIAHSGKKPSHHELEPALQKKVKLNSTQSVQVISLENETEAPEKNAKHFPLQGHYHHGDKPKRIIKAKFEESEGLNYLVFFVEWHDRPDGVTPLPTPITNYDLRNLDPYLLIDFYETRMKAGNDYHCRMLNHTQRAQVAQQNIKEQDNVKKTLNLNKDLLQDDKTEINSPESLTHNNSTLENKNSDEKKVAVKKSNQIQNDMGELVEENKENSNADNGDWPRIINQVPDEDENLLQSVEKGASTATFDQSGRKPESFIGGDFSRNMGITFNESNGDEMIIEPESMEPEESIWATPHRSKLATASKMSAVVPSSNKKKLNFVIDEFIAKKKINDDLITCGEVDNIFNQLKTIIEEETSAHNQDPDQIQAQVQVQVQVQEDEKKDNDKMDEEKKDSEQVSDPVPVSEI